VALALLDDQSVEDGLHVSRIVSRIENVATDALWEYAVRIDNVPVEHSLREQFELLRPMALAGAFRDAMRAADVEASTYLILFNLYERQFLVDACPYYLGLKLRMEAEGCSGKLPRVAAPAPRPLRRRSPAAIPCIPRLGAGPRSRVPPRTTACRRRWVSCCPAVAARPASLVRTGLRAPTDQWARARPAPRLADSRMSPRTARLVDRRCRWRRCWAAKAACSA